MEIPVGQPLHWVAVPIWSGSLEANAVRGRVFALTSAGATLVSDKEYTLPADGDWFELPIVPAPNCSRYRIELSVPKGLVGWYRSGDGSLAYRAWRYAEGNPVTTAASTGSNVMQTNSFAAESPFFWRALEFCRCQDKRHRYRAAAARTAWHGMVAGNSRADRATRK